MKPLNEETVKNQIILPYLKRIGVATGELEFERRLVLRLGTHEAEPPKVEGRLDILVRRAGKNWFVVETKRESKKLSDDDRDQAISYARLLDQIAPFALVTNGREFQLYDTLTKERVEDEVIAARSSKVELPKNLADLREEALELFLGYSAENFSAFCKSQIDVEMEPLRGSTNDRTKKYIPELFEPRRRLSQRVVSFMKSSSPVFVVLADAGVGKTCFVCNQAESFLNAGTPALFYRGSMLSGPLLRRIAEDFAWSFAEEESARNLLRRLNTVLGDRSLAIIVDAIDEWAYSNRVQDLFSAATRLAGSKVKLIVSCKTLSWSDFEKSRDTFTGIRRFVYQSPPSRLRPMEPREFRSTLDRYQAFYGVRGGFEREALDAAKTNLFVLRLLFEVAEQRGEEHLIFSSLEFFEAYYRQLLTRVEDRQRLDASFLLREAARLCLEQGRETVRLYDLQRQMGIGKVSQALPDVLSFQILERVAREPDDAVRFYFPLLRDYLNAYHVLRWQDKAGSELVDALERAGSSEIAVETVSFFYRYADTRQRRLLDHPFFENACSYVRLYTSVLDKHFVNIRSRFSPFTDGQIGFIGQYVLGRRAVGWFGFRSRDTEEEEVLLLPSPGYTSEDHLLRLYGAQHLSRTTDFRSPNVPDEVLNHEVGRQLRAIIDNGKLDESVCPELLAENVGVIVSREREIFSGMRQRSSTSSLFPLVLEEVERWLRVELLRRHFRSERFEKQRRAGKVEERWTGDIVSRSWALTVDDQRWIESRIAEYADKPEHVIEQTIGNDVKTALVEIDPRLSECLDNLTSNGVQQVDEPEWFTLAVDLRQRLWQEPRLTSEEVCDFLEGLLNCAFPLIKRLAEHNFPTLVNEFPSLDSHGFLGVLAVDMSPEPTFQYATLYLCERELRTASGTNVEFAARDVRNVETRIVRDSPPRFEVLLDGRWLTRREFPETTFVSQRTLRLPSILTPHHDYLGTRRRSIRTKGAPPVLRAFVYDWLRVDIQYAFQALCRQYEATAREGEWTFFRRPKS